MGAMLRTTGLLLAYPLWIVLVQFSWNTPQRFVTWGTASTIGLAVFILLFVQLPATFDLLEMGPRAARPLAAYLGGLAVTALIVLATRPRKT